MSPVSRFTAAVLLFAAPLAVAQSADPGAQPCKADIARLCPEAKSRGDVHACMKGKADQVSAECKAKWADFKDKMQAAIEACKPDADRFCADVKPGHGRVMTCLHQHEAELSDACKAVRTHAPAAKQ